MKLIPLRDLTFDSINVADDTTPTWVNTASYNKETTRQLNNKLYRNYADIKALCQYIMDDTDSFNPYYTTTAIDSQPVADNTNVSCTQNVTVVYVVLDNAYYLLTGATGNYDFTNIVFSGDANWTVTTNYRHDIFNPETTPLEWEDLGYVNKYKMLDSSLSTQTTYSGDMTMSFTLTSIDSIFLFNLEASSVYIKVTDTNTTTILLEETTNLTTKYADSWFKYFFNDTVYDNKLYQGVGISYEVTVDITIYANLATGFSKCGLVAIGRGIDLGGTQYGANIGLIDFSKKMVNSNGETYLERGAFKSTNALTLSVPTGNVSNVDRVLKEYRSTPVVFLGSEDIDALTIFGIYTKYETVISLPTYSVMSINLESLI